MRPTRFFSTTTPKLALLFLFTIRYHDPRPATQSQPEIYNKRDPSSQSVTEKKKKKCFIFSSLFCFHEKKGEPYRPPYLKDGKGKPTRVCNLFNIRFFFSVCVLTIRTSSCREPLKTLLTTDKSRETIIYIGLSFSQSFNDWEKKTYITQSVTCS